MKKKFYITTPIYYVNDVPHIGHASTTLVADFLARYYRLNNNDVFFLTGTDEHGLKVAQAAKKNNLSPQKYTDKISAQFEEIWKGLNVSNDYFIRTTNPQHKKIASKIIQKIYDKGDIYQDTYEGLYCVGCEKFLTESDLVDQKCPLHPPDKTVHQKETNWFFKLSKYIPQIIKLIENEKTNYAFPEGKKKEVLSKLKEGVHDISFSRASVDWGIPIPWDNSQTIYVWVEALLNYYTATQFLENKKDFWPADLHLVGKEIIWFHMVIWQAMLLSLGLPLPKKVFAHSFYIMDERKISKSLGNLIAPEELIDKFGVEGTRYLIAASFPANNDANASISRFTEKYNADLANGLGNLVSRVVSLAAKNKIKVSLKNDPQFKLEFFPQVKRLIEQLSFPEALLEIFLNNKNSVDAANKYFNGKRLWEKKGKELEKEINKVIKSILQISYNLKPFLPETSEKIEKIFTHGKIVSSLKKPLFPRIILKM